MKILRNRARQRFSGELKRLRLGLVFIGVASSVPQISLAETFLSDTQILAVSVSGHSDAVREIKYGRSFLSDGSTFSFKKWYSSDWFDLRLIMMTQIKPGFGIVWGFGTGEIGQKYRIQPSLKIGFVAEEPVNRNGKLALSASVVLGGKLREESCIADYGDIGGVQAVNCRYSDSYLPPSDTLELLLDEPPPDRLEVAVRYIYTF